MLCYNIVIKKGVTDMQYFTFLGMSKNYDEIIYHFEDDSNENISVSRYVQVAILDKYKNDIDKIYVFCTQTSYEQGGKEFENGIDKYHKELTFIRIEDHVKIETLIKEMDKVIEDDFIIDVTHCFRNIPISVTMISNYLEISKNKQLKHLFYGSYEKGSGDGTIIDLIKQYQDSKITLALSSFDQFLQVSSSHLTDYEDKKINMLLDSFSKFNHMLDYCEFDSCIHAIDQIYQFSQSLLKESDNYILLTPYLRSIQSKLKDIYTETNNVTKKVKFIKLLLKHNLLQTAITFTDQLIREELVHSCYFPNNQVYKEDLLKQLSCKTDLYNLSQDLLFYLNIRKQSDNYKQKDSIAKIRSNDYKLEKDMTKLKQSKIDEFYLEIRNKVNHGSKINKKIDTKAIIEECIDCIDTFVKG